MLELIRHSVWNVINLYSYPDKRTFLYREIDTWEKAIRTNNTLVIETVIEKLYASSSLETKTDIFNRLLDTQPAAFCATQFIRFFENSSDLKKSSLPSWEKFVSILLRDKDLRSIDLVNRDCFSSSLNELQQSAPQTVIDALISTPHRSANSDVVPFFRLVDEILNNEIMASTYLSYAETINSVELLEHFSKKYSADWLFLSQTNAQGRKTWFAFDKFDSEFYDYLYLHSATFRERLENIDISNLIMNNDIRGVRWVFDHFIKDLLVCSLKSVTTALMQENYDILDYIYDSKKRLMKHMLDRSSNTWFPENEFYFQQLTNKTLRKWVDANKDLRHYLRYSTYDKSLYEQFLYTEPLSRIIRLRSILKKLNTKSIECSIEKLVLWSTDYRNPKHLLAKLRYSYHYHKTVSEDAVCGVPKNFYTVENGPILARIGWWTMKVYNITIVELEKLYVYLCPDPVIACLRIDNIMNAVIEDDQDQRDYIQEHVESHKYPEVPSDYYSLYYTLYYPKDSDSE